MTGIFVVVPFRTLNMSSHCLLASVASYEKQGVDLVTVPLHAMSHWFFAPYKNLSLSLAFLFCCVNVAVFAYVLFGIHWDSSSLGSFLPLYFWSFICSFISFSSLPGTTFMLVCLVVSHISLKLFVYLFFSFSFLCFSACVISIDLSSHFVIFFLPIQMQFRTHPVNFHFNYCAFQIWNFYFFL